MSESSLDIESKFAKALLKLRKIRPFYSSIYEAMDRVIDSSIDTIGVSSTKIVYNKEFIDSLDFEKLLFIDLHEVAHVALMHTSRKGKRDNRLWNIACDLYVNKLISEEFNIYPGNYGDIQMTEDALYCSSLNTDDEYVESIYEEINTQAKNQGYYNGNTVHITYQGNLNTHDSYSVFDIVIQKDKSSGCAIGDDILESTEDENINQQNNKRIVSEAVTKSEMREAGDQTHSLLRDKVNEVLKSYLDWKKLLLKYCIKSTSTDSSFNTPDRRMYYQNAIYPGQSINEVNKISGVKICFDISGSISEDDIKLYYGQIKNLLKDFKVNSEIIYWDTEVVSKGTLQSFKDIDKMDLYGGGGTDPSCIFTYFDSKECKIKPIVTLVFTDGYIREPDNTKWKKKYKDTIWIMTKQHYEGFKPPFGVKAIDKI